ncbi:hypothetical protein B0H17DRAFT_1267045, partial [Mycena rosella]
MFWAYPLLRIYIIYAKPRSNLHPGCGLASHGVWRVSCHQSSRHSQSGVSHDASSLLQGPEYRVGRRRASIRRTTASPRQHDQHLWASERRRPRPSPVTRVYTEARYRLCRLALRITTCQISAGLLGVFGGYKCCARVPQLALRQGQAPRRGPHMECPRQGFRRPSPFTSSTCALGVLATSIHREAGIRTCLSGQCLTKSRRTLAARGIRLSRINGPLSGGTSVYTWRRRGRRLRGRHIGCGHLHSRQQGCLQFPCAIGASIPTDLLSLPVRDPIFVRNCQYPHGHDRCLGGHILDFEVAESSGFGGCSSASGSASAIDSRS